MDLLVLDKNTYYPIGSPLYYYDSLIWTERFFEPSEFELTTRSVKYMRDNLPLWALVSIRQSKEVMMVEEHSIDTDDQGVETLTIRGRSLTSYLKHRVLGPVRDKKYEMVQNYTDLEAALVVLYNSFVNDQAFDLTTGLSATYKNPLDRIPNCVITDTSGSDTGTSRVRFVEPGVVEDNIRRWFTGTPYGIRMVRPSYSADVVTVSQAGNITHTPTTSIASLCFDVYKGTDRSHGQSAIPVVVMDVDQDDLITPNYLFTITQFKSAGHVAFENSVTYTYNPQVFDPSSTYTMDLRVGLDRRVRYFDAGVPEEGADPFNFGQDTLIKSRETMRNENLWYSGIDGSVSRTPTHAFGTAYFLGDTITLRGKYGTITKVRVTEYIRTQDENGEDSYPTLVGL